MYRKIILLVGLVISMIVNTAYAKTNTSDRIASTLEKNMRQTIPTIPTIPWSASEDMESDAIAGSPLINIVTNTPISYAIVFDEHALAGLSEQERYIVTEHRDTVPELIQQSFDTWRVGVKNEIETAGRAEEFKDILKFVSRPVKLKEKSANKAKVVYFFTSPDKTSESGTAKASHNFSVKSRNFVQHTVTLPFPGLQPDNELKYLMSYMTGYVLGLSEQNTLTKNDKYIVRAERYKNEKRNQQISLMDATTYTQTINKNNLQPRLYCDDVDGLINLFDIIKFDLSRKWSEHADKSWVSFCYDDSYYWHGIPTMRNYCWVNYEGRQQKGLSCPDPFRYEGREVAFDEFGLLRYMVDKKEKWLFAYEYRLSNPVVTVTIKSLDEKNPDPDMKVNVISSGSTYVVPWKGYIQRYTGTDSDSTTARDTLGAYQVAYPIYKTTWNSWPKAAPYNTDVLQVSLDAIHTIPVSEVKGTFLSSPVPPAYLPLRHLQSAKNILQQHVADVLDRE